MSKVLNPAWARGSLLLSYRGNSLDFDQRELFVVNDLYRRKIIDGVEHRIVAEVTLFDKTKIILPLNSREIYERKNESYSSNAGHFYLLDVFMNNFDVIFRGSIEYCKSITKNCNYVEPYEFLIVTKYSDEIVKELEQADIKYRKF